MIHLFFNLSISWAVIFIQSCKWVTIFAMPTLKSILLSLSLSSLIKDLYLFFIYLSIFFIILLYLKFINPLSILPERGRN